MLSNNGSYTTTIPIAQRKYYRIKAVDKNGQLFYSGIKVAGFTFSPNSIQISAAPTVILVSVGKNFLMGEYAVFNAAGILLEKKRIINKEFSIARQLNKGVYYIRLTDIEGNRMGRSFMSF
jgi:hypothetical protein